MNDTTLMQSYFAKLGLEPEVAELYLTLHSYGPQNVMQLARNARLERTRVYRLLDTLSDIGLIEVETHYKRKIYKAAPISNLQIVLSQKEQEVRDLARELDDLNRDMTQVLHSPLSHVQFYTGLEGIKQMLWNQTKAETDTVNILYENMQNKTNAAFFERWVERCNTRGVRFRGLIGDHFITTQQQWYASHENERLKHWEARYVPETLFPITHSTMCYDDVVAYYNWSGDQIFGIEIYNNEISQAQRRFFELLWVQAQPVDDVKGLEAA